MLIFAVDGKDGPEPNGHAGEVSHQDAGGGGQVLLVHLSALE